MTTPPGISRPTDHEWISIHVYYAGSLDPMLVECIGPLLRRLRGRGLIDRYFFVRYWLEGPHLRLRLLPARDASQAMVKGEVEGDLTAFITRQPARDDVDHGKLAEHYRTMFVAEYGRQKWEEARGGLTTRRNNTYDYVPYEPEYARYGGLAGTELAEWHFQASSDMVLRLLATRITTARSRAVLLGCSVYLMLGMCYVFLGDDQRTSQFLVRYRDDWERSYVPDPVREARHTEYDARYGSMADRLVERVQEIRSGAVDDPGPAADGTKTQRYWLAHSRDLRDRLVALAGSGQIELAVGDGAARAGMDPEVVSQRLLSSYIHMTNNRLGATVAEEAYLAHVLAAALRSQHATTTDRTDEGAVTA